ncbi:glyoxalase/bleomycin resistance/extradiol dioxygenase family protein, partial [candidate division KSB1 bacterium]|nr:glyoxalase/bleomycin resistance/extradiol dioxygenase family protein [candidate division KSB1 bacterium]NIR71600.1 glyoxalase/bleomycin resistance/extradiol dioxygenase family protein [candidate division KSB1 bacterium]NIS23435.1 glyoxalase/bleomycin resistance/extradiol dioxygenase family protein [candidate division KSB1 bacterium]NIT70343.1 glyoxalase/bleomycin resistance/extradiol dioxygenase family protein [candidate division KSB1 bacterium]NIU24045.1 glyoxalase/bleomycin resistance/extr
AEETKKSGNLPAHGADGAGHVAFAIEHSQIDFWKQRLSQLQIEIQRQFTWPSGGKSIYFVDPSGNLLELVTPDVWA